MIMERTFETARQSHGIYRAAVPDSVLPSANPDHSQPTSPICYKGLLKKLDLEREASPSIWRTAVDSAAETVVFFQLDLRGDRPRTSKSILVRPEPCLERNEEMFCLVPSVFTEDSLLAMQSLHVVTAVGRTYLQDGADLMKLMEYVDALDVFVDYESVDESEDEFTIRRVKKLKTVRGRCGTPYYFSSCEQIRDIRNTSEISGDSGITLTDEESLPATDLHNIRLPTPDNVSMESLDGSGLSDDQSSVKLMEIIEKSPQQKSTTVSVGHAESDISKRPREESVQADEDQPLEDIIPGHSARDLGTGGSVHPGESVADGSSASTQLVEEKVCSLPRKRAHSPTTPGPVHCSKANKDDHEIDDMTKKPRNDEPSSTRQDADVCIAINPALDSSAAVTFPESLETENAHATANLSSFLPVAPSDKDVPSEFALPADGSVVIEALPRPDELASADNVRTLSVTDREQEKTFKCRTCLKTLPSRLDLILHVAQMHPVKIPLPTTPAKRVYPPSVPAKRTHAKPLTAIQRHPPLAISGIEARRYISMTGSCSFFCEDCDKHFFHKRLFDIHQWLHVSNKAPHVYMDRQCPLCDFVAEDFATLVHHTNQHGFSEQEPKPCWLCGQYAVRLADHMSETHQRKRTRSCKGKRQKRACTLTETTEADLPHPDILVKRCTPSSEV